MAKMKMTVDVDKSVWRDAFNLFTDSLDRLEEPDFWDGFFWPRADAITAKHEGDELCAGILVAVHQEIERQRNKICR